MTKDDGFIGFHAFVLGFDRKGSVFGFDLGVRGYAILKIGDDVKSACANDAELLI